MHFVLLRPLALLLGGLPGRYSWLAPTLPYQPVKK